MNSLQISHCLMLLCGSLLMVSIACQEAEKKSEVPRFFDYGDFVKKYHKDYSLLETLARSKLFYSRTIKVFLHNLLYARGEVGHFLRQSEFIDLSPNELKDLFNDEALDDLNPDEDDQLNSSKPATKIEPKVVVETKNEPAVKKTDPHVQRPFPKEKTALDAVWTKKLNVKEFISTIKKEPSLAQEMAAIVDIKSKVNAESGESRQKKFRLKHKIEYKPFVNSTNKNYDPNLVRSYGIFSDVTDKIKDNYAENLIRNLDFDFDIDPFSGTLLETDDYDFDAMPMTIDNLIRSAKSMLEFIKEGVREQVGSNEEGEKIQEKKPTGLIYHVDWRQSGCITAPKSQMNCNSCYAFSVLSMMEFFYCVQKKELTDFSPQYIVDCGRQNKLCGCKGGAVRNVGKFISDHGIELDSMYPYEGKENKCPYDAAVEESKRNGYLRPRISVWRRLDELALWFKWVWRSPMIVGINMPTDFFLYGGRIHSGIDCDESMTHAMLLVGSGQEDGRSFWLLKNSFSEDWGEEGYFRLAHNAPLTCFDSAFVVRANF